MRLQGVVKLEGSGGRSALLRQVTTLGIATAMHGGGVYMRGSTQRLADDVPRRERDRGSDQVKLSRRKSMSMQQEAAAGPERVRRASISRADAPAVRRVSLALEVPGRRPVRSGEDEERARAKYLEEVKQREMQRAAKHPTTNGDDTKAWPELDTHSQLKVNNDKFLNRIAPKFMKPLQKLQDMCDKPRKEREVRARERSMCRDPPVDNRAGRRLSRAESPPRRQNLADEQPRFSRPSDTPQSRSRDKDPYMRRQPDTNDWEDTDTRPLRNQMGKLALADPSAKVTRRMSRAGGDETPEYQRRDPHKRDAARKSIYGFDQIEQTYGRRGEEPERDTGTRRDRDRRDAESNPRRRGDGWTGQESETVRRRERRPETADRNVRRSESIRGDARRAVEPNLEESVSAIEWPKRAEWPGPEMGGSSVSRKRASMRLDDVEIRGSDGGGSRHSETSDRRVFRRQSMREGDGRRARDGGAMSVAGWKVELTRTEDGREEYDPEPFPVDIVEIGARHGELADMLDAVRSERTLAHLSTVHLMHETSHGLWNHYRCADPRVREEKTRTGFAALAFTPDRGLRGFAIDLKTADPKLPAFARRPTHLKFLQDLARHLAEPRTANVDAELHPGRHPKHFAVEPIVKRRPPPRGYQRESYALDYDSQ